MKTIRFRIDNNLLEDVDAAVRELGVSRSAFIRSALKLALQHHALAQQEVRHAAGYRFYTQEASEFASTAHQATAEAWGDDWLAGVDEDLDNGRQMR